MDQNKPLRLEYIDPATLDDNPANWRRHPPAQLEALRDVIAETGWAGALLYNERTKRLVDGHARKAVTTKSGELVPVLIGSWDEEQERKILATLDPLASMAEADFVALDALLRDVSTESKAVQAMLDGLVSERSGDVKFSQVSVTPPPKMTWVLIGIPTVRFGEVSELVEKFAEMSDVIVETTSNNG